MATVPSSFLVAARHRLNAGRVAVYRPRFPRFPRSPRFLDGRGPSRRRAATAMPHEARP
jgi:hypothetical protein